MKLKSSSTKALMKKVQKVSEIIPSENTLSFFEKLTDAYKEHQINMRHIAELEAKKEYLIKEMENKYELYHKVFDNIFDERRMAIGKSFEIIDKGLKDNDKELISMGLKSLSTIVSSSPFGDLGKLSNMIENNQVIDI